MITYFKPHLMQSKVVAAITKVLNSTYFPFIMGGLAVVSNLFGLELPVYYIITVFTLLAVLFCDDLICFIPMICCAYITVSANNNPAINTENSIFHRTESIAQFAVIICVLAILLITRLIFDTAIRKDKAGRGKGIPKLTYGFIALGVGFMISGIFGKEFDYENGVFTGASTYLFKSTVFGLVEIISLCVFYFYLYYTIDWTKICKNYIALAFTAVGAAVIIEVIAMYFRPGVITENGVVRNKFLIGWGNYNNVGGVLAMCVPAPFYFAYIKKNVPMFIVGGIFTLFTAITQSRSSMLIGFIIGAICVIIILIKAVKHTRKAYLITLGAVLIIGILGCVVFAEQLQKLMASIIKIGASDNGRFKIYENGLTLFLKNPIFGNNFYSLSTSWRYGDLPEDSFLPSRFHNTIVQLLATGGVTLILTYAFHRIQTLKLLFKNPTAEKTFVFLCILSLLLTSMFDCHFFNLGPGLLYSCLLVFAEGMGKQPQSPVKQTETE